MIKNLFNLKAVTLCLLFWCCAIQLKAQSFEWARAVQGTGTLGSYGRTIAVDDSGNSYIAGAFEGTADLDPTSGVQLFTAMAWDMYLLKLNAAGSFVWAKQFKGLSGTPYGVITTAALDTAGNILLNGYFTTSDGVFDFDPGAGVAGFTTSGDMSNIDVFVIKLNHNGDYVWGKQMGGKSDDESTSMCVDSKGDVLITGYFTDTADFDPGTGVAKLGPLNNQGDAFVVKLDKNGNYVWAHSFGTPIGNTISQSIKTDAADNVYTTGRLNGTVDFDPGSGVKNLSPATGGIYISKLSANGDYVWAKNLGTTIGVNDMGTTSISLDGFGNIYATGYFSDTTDFEPGAGTTELNGKGDRDVFILKLDTAGNFKWAKSIGGTSSDIGWRIAADKYGYVYIYGYYRSHPIDFDPSDTGVVNEVNGGYHAIFLLKLDSTGRFKRAIDIAGSSSSEGYFDIALSPVDNSIYLTGGLFGTIDFDPSGGNTELTDVSGGGGNAFILKLSNCIPLVSNSNVGACDTYTFNNISYTASGIYKQEYQAVGGCDSIIVLNVIIGRPSVTVTKATNQLTATETGATYQWIDCNNGNSAISGATSQTFTATHNGNYAVIVSKNGCNDTSDCNSIDGLSVREQMLQSSISIHPNPTQSYVNITSSKSLTNASISLTNVIGQVVTGKAVVNGQSLKLDISSLPPGIYIVEVNEAGKIYRTKVIKE